MLLSCSLFCAGGRRYTVRGLSAQGHGSKLPQQQALGRLRICGQLCRKRRAPAKPRQGNLSDLRLCHYGPGCKLPYSCGGQIQKRPLQHPRHDTDQPAQLQYRRDLPKGPGKHLRSVRRPALRYGQTPSGPLPLRLGRQKPGDGAGKPGYYPQPHQAAGADSSG